MERIRNEAGVAMLIVAFGLVACFGIMALAIDGGFLATKHLDLQTAYDAAALRGTFSLFDGETDTSKVTQLTREIVRANLLAQGADATQAQSVADATTVTFSDSNKRVDVNGSMPQTLWFASVMPGFGPTQNIAGHSSAVFTLAKSEIPTSVVGNVIVVADNSDSMGESYGSPAVYVKANGQTATASTKSAALVSAVQMLIAMMNGQTLAIVDFGASCKIILQPIVVSDDYTGYTQSGIAITNRQAAMLASLKLLNTELGTDINCGLVLGASLFAQMPQNGLKTSMLLLTDGEPTTSDTAPLNAMNAVESSTGVACNADKLHSDTVNAGNWVRQLGFEINTIGIGNGSDYDPNFLKVIAGDPQGTMLYPCTGNSTIGATSSPQGIFTEAINANELYGAVAGSTQQGSNSSDGPRRVNG